MKTICSGIAAFVFAISVVLLVFWPVALIFGFPPILSGNGSRLIPPLDLFVGLLNFWGVVFYPVIVILSIFLMVKTRIKYHLALFLPLFYLTIIVLMIRQIKVLGQQ